jgi:hypothetical protein
LFQLGKEVIPQVVFDVTRGTNQNPAHQEAKVSRDNGNANEQRGVLKQFGARDTLREIVNRELLHTRRKQRNCRIHQDAGKAEKKRASVAK